VNNPNTLLIEKCFIYEYATITLPLLAERLGLSTRQTQRLLQETYSATFRQMKAEAQMSAAISLLQDLDLSITTISERLGFSSPEHFSNNFRRYFGVSPRTYRKTFWF
jgi:AraC-like DNA-binding protein